MVFHPGSVALQEYFAKRIQEIAKPLTEIQLADWKEGELRPPSGWFLLSVNFTILAYQVSDVYGGISEKEVAFLLDIKNLCEGNRFISPIAVNNKYKEAQRDINRPGVLFRNISMPSSLSFLQRYDAEYSTNHANTAKAIFFQFADAMVKADGKVTPQKINALNKFRDLLYPPNLVPTTAKTVQNTDKSLAELNALVGLSNIKSDVTQLVNFLKVQQMRQAKGLPSVPITRHLVFSGNPGTGKTSVARLIAQIYQSLGILSKGHMIETDRSGLVGAYLGQTALKVKEVVTQAMGGVLFIDEAYALVNERQDQYGNEAIETLLKLMEDNRDDLIVIVAGYTDKMDKFLLSNPGLKSRFNKFFTFHDYTPSELVAIFEGFCKTAGFTLMPAAQAKLLRLFQAHHAIRDETFANGRLARNVFEQTLSNQANRIVMLTDISETALSTIGPADIPNCVMPEATSNV